MSRAPIRLWLLTAGMLSLLLGGATWAEPKGATVEARMSAFKNDRGKVVVGLFKKTDEFPDINKKATMRGSVKIKNRKATYKFKNVKPGVWAIAVYHDENNNGKLDTNFLGIPKEGWGASRNPRPRMGAPDFDDAKFTVKAGDRAFRIKITY
jgi:uncharacterized protein (DUF2141 family)